MTRDVENVNKKWDTKILGITKAYEMDKRFLKTEKERCIPFYQTPSPPTIAVNDTNKNLESTTYKTSHSREQTRNDQTTYRKTDKTQKNCDRQPTKHRKKR